MKVYFLLILLNMRLYFLINLDISLNKIGLGNLRSITEDSLGHDLTHPLFLIQKPNKFVLFLTFVDTFYYALYN